LLQQRLTLVYLPDALVCDVHLTKPFERQRTRWIAAQYKYFPPERGGRGFQPLLTGNIDYADKVFQTMILPRVLLLRLVLGCCRTTMQNYVAAGLYNQ
jgi:hypothetical protein